MKIILNEKIDTLGEAGQVVSVKSGYARNYLFPRGLATVASDKNIRNIEKLLKEQENRDARTHSNLEALSEKLNKLTLKFTLKAGEDEKLFGSVTSAMISEEIINNGFTIDKKEIILDENIKNIGNHFVNIKLSSEISAKVKIKVSAEK
tara:strand:+ start:78 stop:524 length:447 start_codon:yes stop_codon:yes gene_type:complete